MKKNKFIITLLQFGFVFIMSALVYNFSGCSDSFTNPTVTTASKYQAHTEAEFNANSNLKAIPGAVVYDDLEHLNTPASLLGDDTGPIGEDVISYYYSDSAVHRFKLGAEANFKVRMIAASGLLMFQLNNPGDTARVSIPAGNYKLYLTSLVNYGSTSMATQPVFIQPDLDAIASGGVPPQSGYNKDDLNTLLTTNKCISCNLREVQLHDKNLAGADLSYSDLEHSFMDHVNLDSAIFTHTDWDRSGANNCSFKGAKFTFTILNLTSFGGGDFMGAVFQRLNWDRTIFDAANLSRVTFDSGSGSGNMDGCDLSYTTFSNLEIRDLTGEHVKLNGATFSNIHAYEVFFGNSNLDSTKFINNTYFQSSTLRGSTFRNALFTNFRGDASVFDDCIMSGSAITNSGFNGGTLRAAILINTVWNNVDINAVNMCHQDRTGMSATNIHYNVDTDCWP
ncbi:MAG: pentapeptide repeat-containing protein [Bacteroidetes bacterium]|nr:pentapeptide repeat-containing protein [Bacteroidota bacterium]